MPDACQTAYENWFLLICAIHWPVAPLAGAPFLLVTAHTRLEGQEQGKLVEGMCHLEQWLGFLWQQLLIWRVVTRLVRAQDMFDSSLLKQKWSCYNDIVLLQRISILSRGGVMDLKPPSRHAWKTQGKFRRGIFWKTQVAVTVGKIMCPFLVAYCWEEKRQFGANFLDESSSVRVNITTNWTISYCHYWAMDNWSED